MYVSSVYELNEILAHPLSERKAEEYQLQNHFDWGSVSANGELTDRPTDHHS